MLSRRSPEDSGTVDPSHERLDLDGSTVVAAAWHVRGTVLPSGRERDVYVTHGRFSFEPVAGASTLSRGGYLLPGLVDVHCHPGTAGIGEPIDEHVLRDHSSALLHAGVLLVRVPGSAPGLPAGFGHRSGQPRAIIAGSPVAAPGRFFPGWGHQVPLEHVPSTARHEAALHGWAKLIGDWFTEDGGYAPSIPAAVMEEAVHQVHDVGGRVAVHTQHAQSGLDAVMAGADSIEHGLHLPMSVLPVMAERGTTLVPTAVTFAAMAEQMSSDQVPDGLRAWFSSGWSRHAELVTAAHAAGVRVLAGTDLPPGALTAEVEWLDQAGLGDAALAGASWAARAWLGLSGIEHGAPADLVCYPQDPRTHPAVLSRPTLVMLGGELLQRTEGPRRDR
jgi:imidazolonepropionase-like amidohydrolase